MCNSGSRQKIRRTSRFQGILLFMFMLMLLPWPAGAQTTREIEPNDRDAEAMVVMPGNTVDASWSHARSKETGRGTDRDVYKLSGFTYPATYTFTVKPSTTECKYSFGLTNMRGPFSGAVTLTIKVEAQDRVTYTYSGGGQSDYQYVLYDKDPLNNRLLILEPTFRNSDHQGGFQCAKDGAVRQTIPYQLTITSASAPVPAEAPKKSSDTCIRESEPNDRDTEAMNLSSGTCIDASWSHARSKETRHGTDRDVYKLSGFAYPATYTFTVKPSAAECKYWVGLTNTRGPFNGAVTLTVKVEEQNRVTYTYSGGSRPDYQYVLTSKDPLNHQILIIEPTFLNSDHQGGFQCAKDGAVRQDIPYQLSVAEQVAASPPTIPPSGTDWNLGDTEAPLGESEAPKEITLEPGMSWEGKLPSAPYFELFARIQWRQAAGAASLLEVRINGKEVTTGLANKHKKFQYADGREFPYYAESAHAWTIFYSPDYSANNSSEAGVYEVVSNPGQAYRYRWGTGLSGGPPMKVNLRHNGLAQAPIIIQLMQ